jgi:GT2 family glycosyltransferase
MELSVLIVNWNTRDLLAQCLTSIVSDPTWLAGYSAEVWVVDNASSDGSPEMVREQFPWVKLIENGENVGFARANNQAIRRSSGAYLLLLNSDTAVKPHAVQRLLSFMAEHPEVGAAGARLFYADGTMQTSCYPAPSLSRELWRLFHLDALWPYSAYRVGSWDFVKTHPVDVLLGACLMLRREVVDQVGLLDETYFMYSEEVDLCHRIRQAGWLIRWVPEAEVIHFSGQSTKQAAVDMFLQLYHGKLRYFRKHHGRTAGWLYRFILCAAAVTRLLITPLIFLERPSRRRRHLHLANCYRRLLFSLPTLK